VTLDVFPHIGNGTAQLIQGTINTELLTMEDADPTEYVTPNEFKLSLDNIDEPLLERLMAP